MHVDAGRAARSSTAISCCRSANSPAARSPRSTRDGDGYVALASFCVEAPKTSVTLPITAKLLVDCSGSMAGDSIAAAKRAMHRIFANLESEDRVVAHVLRIVDTSI